MYISHIRGWKSIRISDTLDYRSAILSIFQIQRITNVSEFLIIWTASLQFKYFWDERISKASEFLILWNTSFCSFKYISHIRDLKNIRISDTLDYQSAILSIFEIERISKVSEFLLPWSLDYQFLQFYAYFTYTGLEKYQNFWYFGLPVCNFKHFWDRQDFKSIRISDTLEYQFLQL
jgi:hypothetical protein